MTFSWMTPHTTQKASRECKDCHNKSKTIGFGDGNLFKKNNKWFFEPVFSGNNFDMKAPMDSCIDINGTATVNFSRKWLRGFNKAETDAILNAGICIKCHGDYNDKVMKNWDNIKDKTFCPVIKSSFNF